MGFSLLVARAENGCGVPAELKVGEKGDGDPSSCVPEPGDEAVVGLLGLETCDTSTNGFIVSKLNDSATST